MARFACPVCSSVISIETEQAGSVLACPSCGKKIRVPAGKSASSDARQPKVHPQRTEAREASLEADEIHVVEKGSALTQKKVRPRDEEEEDDIPARPKGSRLRTAPREEAEADEADDENEDDEADDRKRRKRRGKKTEKEAGGVMAVFGILGSLGSLIGLALFILIISGKGPRWLMDFIEARLLDSGIPPLVAGGITVLVFMIPLGLWVLLTLKGQILNAMPDELDFRTTTPSKYPELDGERLEQFTEEYESLGFTRVVDYTVTTELENFPSGFARLFVHEEEGCYAEVNQGFTADGEAVPMRSLIVSHFDEGWSLSTTDRTPSKESYLMRRPRAVWRSLPDKDPADLLAHHRKMRKKMIKALEIQLVGKRSKNAYFNRENEANRERKEVVRKRWTLGILIEFFFFDRNPKFEWRGEYAGVAAD